MSFALTRGRPFRRALHGVALVLVAFASACDGIAPGSPPPAQLTDPKLHAVHVGLEMSGPAEGALGKVVSARLTSDGKHVVVLDFVAPYVKVFDARGRLEAAFLKQGGGPEEARRPTALGVAGDSLVLVGDGMNGIAVFDLHGTFRARARPAGLMPLAAAACPDGWIVYGPRLQMAGAGAGLGPWVHRLRFAGPDSAEVHSMWPDTVPDHVSAGLPYGVVADGDGVMVWHTGGTRSAVLRVPCGAGQSRLVRYRTPSNRARPIDTPKGIRTSVSSGTRSPAGVAVFAGGTVFGEKVFISPEQPRVDFTLLTEGGERTLSLAGDFVLNDSHPGVGVLVSTSDPVPQLFLLKPADFLAMFPSP